MRQAFPGDKLSISAADWNRVRRVADNGSTGIGVTGKRIYADVAIAYTGASGISARSGTTLGTGTITLYGIDSAGLLVSTTETAIAYNITQSAVVGNTYIVVGRETRTLQWVVIVEDCGAGGS
jgi:hypothetical protein